MEHTLKALKALKGEIDAWLSFCECNYSAMTVKVYRCVIFQLLRFVSNDNNELNTTAIENFLNYKYKDGGSKCQFNTYRIVIRSFCGWRCRKYKIESPADEIPKIKEYRHEPRVLSLNEYRFVLNSVSGMDHDIIEFLGNTGLRRDEFRRLRWKNIDATLKFIRINGKGDKTRVVPLNNTAKQVLLKYKRLDDQPLQIAAKYYGSEGPSWLCKRISRKTGMKRFGSHAIRHYFASSLLKKGVNLFVISRLLGHASIKTTEIYLHLNNEDLYGSTDVLD